MTPFGARVFRWGAVVVPVLGLLLLFHFLSPSLRTKYRERTLPAGYENIGVRGPYVLFARPENSAAIEAADVLDRFIAAVLAEYGEALDLTPPASRFEVVVFSTYPDLTEYTRSELGNDFKFNGGFYSPYWRVIAVVGREGDPEIVRALFHEGTHMVLDTFASGEGHTCSAWLSEGFATYLEASRFTGTSPKGRLGGYDARLVALLRASIRQGAWPGVRSLLSASEAEFSGENNTLFYAGSALLVHYLLEGEGGRNRERFFSYYERERRPGPVPAGAFEGAFGDPDDLDLRVQRHVLGLP